MNPKTKRVYQVTCLFLAILFVLPIILTVIFR